MKNIFIILMLLIPALVISQTRQEQYETAKAQIKELKEGVLLVRLNTNQPVIDALTAQGSTKKADYIKKKQEEKNREITQAFSDFKFCKVYFFYSNYSDSLKQNKFENIEILNDSLQPIQVELTSFFIADFGNVKKDYENDTIDAPTQDELAKKGIETKKKYKGGSNLSIRAMVISDASFNQLRAPFPFYTRFHPTPLHDLTHKQVVDKMEEKLNDFY